MLEKSYLLNDKIGFGKEVEGGRDLWGEWGLGVGFEWVMNNNLYYILLMEGEVVKGSVNSLLNGEPSCQKRRRRKIVKS